MKEKFYEYIYNTPKRKNSFQISSTKYSKLITEIKLAKSGMRKDRRDRWLLKHYDVMKVDTKEMLIVPSIVSDRIIFYVALEELFDILYDTHISIGHGGRDKMRHVLQQRYKNITFQDIQMFLNLCATCLQKRNFDRKGSVINNFCV